MMKYKCPDCGEKELEKQVYTKERCLSCGFTNHNPHRNKRIKELKKQKGDELRK